MHGRVHSGPVWQSERRSSEPRRRPCKVYAPDKYRTDRRYAPSALVFPSSISSPIAPRLNAITGVPHAIASTTLYSKAGYPAAVLAPERTIYVEPEQVPADLPTA